MAHPNVSLADQLEHENKQMALRLQELKLAMRKRKETRVSRNKEVIWNSARPKRSISQPSKDKLIENGKLQKESPRRASKTKPVAGGEAHITTRARESPFEELKGTDVDETPNPEAHEQDHTMQPSVNGSYDEGAAHEDFLQALNEWRRGAVVAETKTTKIQPKEAKTEVARPITTHQPHSNGASLFDGTYDEQKHAQEFQAAVMAWRQGKKDDVEPQQANATTNEKRDMWVVPQTTASEGCQTAAKRPVSAPVSVQFKSGSSLTYMERLMLNRQRKGNNLSRITTPKTISKPSAQEENDDEDTTPKSTHSSAELNLETNSTGVTESKEPWAHGESGIRVSVAEVSPSKQTASVSDSGVDVGLYSVEEPLDDSEEDEEHDNVEHSSEDVVLRPKDYNDMSGDFSPARKIVTPGIMHDFEEMEAIHS